MSSYNRDNRPGLFTRMTRPGTLLALLIIGLGIFFLVGSGQRGDLVLAEASDVDQRFSGEDYDEGDEGDDWDGDDTSDDGGEREGSGDDVVREGSEEDIVREGSDKDKDSEGRHRECIHVRSIDDFHVIDDRHITVSTSRTRVYLLTLWNRCRQLNWTHQIAIKSHGSWTCSYSKDVLLVDGDRCMIDDIERVASVDEAEEIVAERTGADMDDDEGEGAE